jgi:hypothetical protein
MPRIAMIDFSGAPATRRFPEDLDISNGVLQQRLLVRRRAVASIYPIMEQFLHRALKEHSSKRNLLEIAQVIAQGKNVKLDRMAKRSKECLICWFCEVAQDLLTQSGTEGANADDRHHIAKSESESAEQVACPVHWADIDLDYSSSDHQLLGRGWELSS